jgi:hypothetical protein
VAAGSQPVTLGTLALNDGTGAASDYTFVGGVQTATVTAAALTAVALTGTVTKTYDGTNTVSNLTSGNYGITGFVAGEGATINVTTGTYDNGKDVVNNPAGSPVTSSVLAAGNYTANAGTLLSDYNLGAVTGVSATGNIGAITPKGVTITGTAANNKVYDGSTLATLSNIGSVSTGVGAETLVLNGPAAANINFNTKDVATANLVTGTGYSIADGGGGGLASNYALTSTSSSAAANITPKALTAVSLVGTVTKPYDGTNTVSNLTTGNYSIAGFVAGEGATINVTTGTYDNGPNVANNPPGSPVTSSVLAAGNYTANAGTLLNDYNLGAVTGVSATGNIGAITNAVNPTANLAIPDSVLASLYSGNQLPPPTVSGPTGGWRQSPGMPSSLPGVQPNSRTAGGGPAAAQSGEGISGTAPGVTGTAGSQGQQQGQLSNQGAETIPSGAVRDLVTIINGGVRMSSKQGVSLRRVSRR